MRRTARGSMLAGGLGLMLLAAGCGEGVAGNQRQLSRSGDGQISDGTQLAGTAGGGKPSQPGAPAEESRPLVRALAFTGGYAVALVPEALVVIDLGDPAAPRAVATRVLAKTPVDLSIDGVHAFVACDTGGLQVVSLAKPREPQVVGAYAPQNGAISCVAAANGVAVVGIPGTGAAVLDVSDPSQPTEVKLISGKATIQAVGIAEERAYLLADKLHIVALEEPARAEIIATHETKHALLGLGFEAGQLLLGDAAGYRLLDPSSPQHVITVGQLEQAAVAGALAEPVTVQSKGAATKAAATPDVVTSDEAQSGEPEAEPATPAPEAPARLALADGRAYRTAGDDGVWVLTIDDGRKLTPLRHIGGVGRASCVAAADALVLVGNTEGEVAVYEWTADGELTRLGSLALEPVRGAGAAAPAPEPPGLNPPAIDDATNGVTPRRPGDGGAEPGF